ncbi:MAG: protein-disulfide reductase DsbD family protein [Bryobacterales bacterium]|nr:protein-disulfide reductase DsbD family protein [Bryobacterales bacterium]MDE0264500.1 protein-disulfide reductase DsbD family protein [Bryobacterales bacterium]MDE0621658.1 protein-disulfide reductase DsbD family protein [Bryobacterales bacterium]
MNSRPLMPCVLVALALAQALLPGVPAAAQIYDPVQWRLELAAEEYPPGATVLARLTAEIEDGWHFYSTTTPEGIPLAVGVAESDAVSGWRAHQPDPEIVFDPNFQAEVEWYTDEAVLLVEIDLAEDISGEHTVEALVRYGACDDRQCLAPKRKSATAVISVNPAAEASAVALPAGYQPVQVNPVGRPRSRDADSLATAAAGGEVFKASNQGFLGFSLLALGFGFVAILTPCVFPMIPIYMGSFMSDANRPWGAVLRQAGTFCLGVIVLFTALGGVLSATLGPFGLSQIGSNAWANLLIAAVMLFFALSMLGAFELTVPSGWTTAASKHSDGTGVVATLMLSLVFTLASFACTGPFIGSLLAGSVAEGSSVYPILGMTLFATGLSAPFFVLAMFPALVNKLPRSGGWLAVSKRTAGILILAVGLKYLGNVDQVLGWDVLSRERFLAIWMVLFVAAALYLWGVLRLGDDAPAQSVGLVRFGFGAAFLALALSVLPGMFGGSLGELEAHIPEASGPGLGAGSDGSLVWIKDDYEGAAASARNASQPLLVSFTGYACSNCKWMKANMFTKPEIDELIRDFVLVELYTDGFDEASERNQAYQVERFRSSSIPFYALILPDGSVAATFSGQTRDAQEFRTFLMSVG